MGRVRRPHHLILTHRLAPAVLTLAGYGRTVRWFAGAIMGAGKRHRRKVRFNRFRLVSLDTTPAGCGRMVQ